MEPVDWSLYAVTPDDVESEALFDLVTAALEAGISVLQVRRKRVSARQLLGETARIMEEARSYGVPVVVNDRLDVALAAAADGVHLGQGDVPVEVARRIAPPTMIVGASTHDAEEARAASRAGATYAAVGPVYSTPSKRVGTPGGVELIRSVRRVVEGPLIAIGGIGPEHVQDVLAAGADGVAVISGIFGGGSVQTRVKQYREAIAEARSTREPNRA